MTTPHRRASRPTPVVLFAPDALDGMTADEVAEFLAALTDAPDTIGLAPLTDLARSEGGGS